MAPPDVVRLTEVLPRIEHLWRRATVYQLAKEGRLVGVYRTAGTYVVNRPEFFAWLAKPDAGEAPDRASAVDHAPVEGKEPRAAPARARIPRPAMEAAPPGDVESKALERFLRGIGNMGYVTLDEDLPEAWWTPAAPAGEPRAEPASAEWSTAWTELGSVDLAEAARWLAGALEAPAP